MCMLSTGFGEPRASQYQAKPNQAKTEIVFPTGGSGAGFLKDEQPHIPRSG